MVPILYSFRRCPYAMRARLAIAVSGVEVVLREILLRDKPSAFLDVSPSATVPCLVHDGGVIDESLEVMRWALAQNDPGGWLDMPDDGWTLIAQADGPFKDALDKTKYASRYPDEDAFEQRKIAAVFLQELDGQLDAWLYDRARIADFAILPFVRQFANIDRAWFDAQDWPRLRDWLVRFETSERFAQIMEKLPVWQDGDAPHYYLRAG